MLENFSAKDSFDLILLDLMLPGISGFDGYLLIRAKFPHSPVLIFSGLSDAKIVAEAIRMGAAGFVPKSASKTLLAEAVKEVYSGKTHIPKEIGREVRALLAEKKDSKDIALRVAELTPSQIRVLQLLKQGLLNKQIAHSLASERRPSRRMSARS